MYVQTVSLSPADEGGREKSSVLEAELVEAERTVGELRSEAVTVKQDLQNALDLCNEHEALMEERNEELATCDSKIRCAHEKHAVQYNITLHSIYMYVSIYIRLCIH